MRKPVGKILSKVVFLIAIAAVTALFIGNPSPLAAQFSNKVTTTPAYTQDAFGPAGDSLPYDGLEYCFPTATSMLLSYLGVNGFNQIGPSNPTSADELNLTRVMAGLMRTDPITGTGSNPGVAGAIQIYLAAKGIGAHGASSVLACCAFIFCVRGQHHQTKIPWILIFKTVFASSQLAKTERLTGYAPHLGSGAVISRKLRA